MIKLHLQDLVSKLKEQTVVELIPKNNIVFGQFFTQITGGAGFVGSHLVDALMMAGHEVLLQYSIQSFLFCCEHYFFCMLTFSV